MKEDKKKKREELIIREAKKMIQNKGFHKAAMSKIAENCGLAVGTLYNYFESKNDILLAIFIREINMIVELGRKVITRDPDDPVTHIMELFKTYVKVFDIYSKTFWINFMVEAETKIEISNVNGQLWINFEQLKHQFEELIITLIKKGMLREDHNPGHVAKLLFNIYYIYFREYIYSDYDIPGILSSIQKELEIIYHGIKA